jgi:hypothetical protein
MAKLQRINQQYWPSKRVINMKNRTFTISFRTGEEIRNALEKISKEEKRSISSIIETALYLHLTERNKLESAHDEKRRFPRKNVSLPALISKLDSEDKTLHAGIVMDISLGGLQISIPKNCKYEINEEKENVNTMISIVFTLPGSKKPLSVLCSSHHLFYSNEDISIGASFEDADFGSYQTIRDYLLNGSG